MLGFNALITVQQQKTDHRSTTDCVIYLLKQAPINGLYRNSLLLKVF